MGPRIIARNYAETLLTLARRQGGEETVDAYGQAMYEVADLLRAEPAVRQFLETPRVDAEAKKRAIRASFSGRVPEHFLRFLLVVVEKRRQALLPAIAEEYRTLVDEARGRIRADIAVARPDPVLEGEIVAALERRYGKTVIPTFRVDPALVGGVLIRVEDQILDGSFRRRVAGLRRRLLEAPAALRNS
jgi:F-type H+-transporting ATPase subunit delta